MPASTQTRTVVDLVVFHFAWAGVVWGAADRTWGLVALSAVVHLVVHLALSPRILADLGFAVAAGTAGWLLDTLLGLAGVYRFSGTLAPAWLWVLWVVFATTLDPGFRWFRARPVLAGLLGLVAGPFSYEMGVRLGALSWGVPPWRAWIVLAAAWALALPALLAWRARWTVPGHFEGSRSAS